MSSLPMYFPSDFDLSTACLCVELTAHAYKMYQQWEDEGKPRKEAGFTRQPPTGTGLTFSSPIWSTYRWLFVNDSEPFGFIASDGGVINTCDVVPQLPSPLLGEFVYKHVGTPVNFTAQYSGIGDNHNLTHAYGYALNYPDQPENPKAKTA